MAIQRKIKGIDTHLEHRNKSSSRKLREYDYSTPVRLKQLPVSQQYNADPAQHKHKVNANQSYQVKMILPISIESSKLMYSKFVASTIIVAISIICAQICHCDITNINHDHHPQPMERRSTGGGTSSSHKEHLLSTLSESIERQHFKINPIMAFKHPRQSKFDSGDDSGEKFFETSLHDAPSNHIQITHSSPPLSSSTSVSVKKVDESMRHILRMHESANVFKSNQNGRPTLPGPLAKSGSGVEATSQATSWRQLVKSPVRAAATLMHPTKIVSNVFSYIAPLTSGLKPEASTRDTPSILKNFTSNGIMRARALNSFAGRANNQNAAPIIAANPFKFESNLPRYIRLEVTSPPQSLFLAKPDVTKASEHQAATQPTIAYGTNEKYPALKSLAEDSTRDLMAESSYTQTTLENVPGFSSNLKSASVQNDAKPNGGGQVKNFRARPIKPWLKHRINQHKAPNYLQESFRDLLALSQLPILSGSPVSTAPSVLERGGKLQGLNKTSSSIQEQNQSIRAIDELLRYAYILGTSARRKRDPLKALSSNANPTFMANHMAHTFNQRSIRQLMSSSGLNLTSMNYIRGLRSILSAGLPKNAKPRGVMWDMATDPSLAVTVFHLLERASVALPLGFLLMPFVRMIRNPLNGFNLGRIIPARASHRSVDYEELAKRLDVVDKMLSRALRPTHREAFIGK